MKKFYFTIKLLKRGFVANAKWRKEPGFGMLHHISFHPCSDHPVIFTNAANPCSNIFGCHVFCSQGSCTTVVPICLISETAPLPLV